MTCPTCGTENREGRKFCSECGSVLASVCTSCGAPNEPGEKFCGECGEALAAQVPRSPATVTAAPVAERRLVSVLFADLVGFTTTSERRDPEDTRELLSRYFEIARTTTERYGGTIEKFIGDAVMAVWGTPAATEDDAERAVRAALELVAAVPELDTDLDARAGVLTGEVAVTLGAEGQGMVAGDLVNTASRIQALAEPGTVLVGEATKRASEAAVAYEDAGRQELRGKAEPVQVFRALRVVANRGGEGRSEGLEAPFVGRDRELRLVKELFQLSADEGRAHLVLVTGIAGIGKSRLGWEFEKYVDGLVDDVWWHRGRCPSYGEGVAYWALAEMVRGRARIVESEEPEEAQAKLAASVALHVSEAADREWVEPRLAHLVGLRTEASYERDDLFAAWRFFLESLAGTNPSVLVFEDLQWADAGLLDFIEYLLEWAHSKPLFVIALARPELAERRPGFGTASRGFTGLALEPLRPEAMEQLLDGLVPGLPPELKTSIRDRSEGVPLYAVETVRMLLDHGRLERSSGTYRVVGTVETLDVPETLHALVAARLDGLTADERRLVQDASVLGKTFAREALAFVSGRARDDLEPLLDRLVRKEILFLEGDPRSPERGQYGFLQDLVRRVAYETLSRRDRKSRHLAAADFFESSWGGREQEVVEVVASHYLTALELDPEADDAAELRAHARRTLAGAGERAASLGATAEAATSFARAAELADDAVGQAALLAKASKATNASGDSERATELALRAIALYEGTGDRHAAARVSADLGHVEFANGRLDRALERMEAAYAVLEADEPDEDLAYFLSQLARYHYFAGNYELAEQRNDRALAAAERLRLPEVLSHALNTAGLLATQAGHWETARAFISRALDIALENDLTGATLRGYTNMSVVLGQFGEIAEANELTSRSVELARRIGDRQSEWFALGNLADGHLWTGAWDELMRLEEELPLEMETRPLGLHYALAAVARERGDVAAAHRALERAAPLASSASLQDRNVYAATKFVVLSAEGRDEEALALAEETAEAFAQSAEVAWIHLSVAEAALRLGRVERAAEAVASVEALPPGDSGPLLKSATARFRALVAAAQGDEQRAESSFKSAAAAFDEYGTPFFLACTRLEHAEWLAAEGRSAEAEPLLAAARDVFERLQAAPWLERAERLVRSEHVPA